MVGNGRMIALMNLHAHVSTSARDCDGETGHEYVSTMNSEEKASDFPDLDFKARVLSCHVSFDSEFGVTVQVDEGGFVMREQTDEGYRSAEVRWCEDDDCDENQSSQYDQFAEAAGY